MNSAAAMVLYVIFLLVGILAAKVISDRFGLPAGAILFVVLFLIGSFALGTFASRRLIVTHEDQEKARTRK